MSFNDFKGIWVVREAFGGEDPGDRIAIGGRPNRVWILCVDQPSRHLFNRGRYEEAGNRIVVPVDTQNFEITLKPGEPNEISCRPVLGPPQGPGSWTADDNSGDDGN